MKYLTALLIAATFALAGCDQDDGPAEEAGEKIDEVATDVENKVEDACEELKEKADAKDQDC
ncbi:hypothetical protein [Pleionea mediterranea]|jgi:outer membrane murein-binding lipoprotein Lpp|uniref:Small secreted protein n=1 Tax=Pleionea mediterranea TaxID=523701 RepID=A0A316FSQ7_9GAMM|nr:hypothetical protein [Pleionea mediterranea]PWK51724.1 hypothetical protein C8D97_10539 [Pleionea mediterranea]